MFTTINELIKIQKKIAPYIHETPVMSSEYFNDISGCKAVFKCENFQKMGAFKMRGAMNAVMSLDDESRSRGVITHSSGNFGQAVALAARNLGIKAVIVMPSNAPAVKKAAIAGYGAEIIECEPTNEARASVTARISKESGAVILHPSNQKEVIDGNASAAIELINFCNDASTELDAIITPVGGGGLLAGTALAAKGLIPEIEVFAGEPSGADDAYRSLKEGVIQASVAPHTIADGLKTQLGECNFPIIQKYVNEIILVEEDEIVSAMQIIWERMKLVIEPSSAVAPAAILKRPELFKDKNVGIILSGGNVQLDKLPF
ncbi:MAG: pyridoxal-phosphate dependent enzyme [Spirochaetales bacterium]|nr:pyridoxal-phosphate dependent enzyme [Spirochaetales bacterium]